MTGDDPTEMVRRGYDELSYRYRDDHDAPALYAAWSAELTARLDPAGARVLDLGCGCGIPVARDLCAAGHHVTAVDLSAVQIERAGRLVPAAHCIQADATAIDFPKGSFDAIVCIYVIIHVPLAEQGRLLAKMAAWLRPGGWLLLTAGHERWTGVDSHWLGGHTPMWWDHADSATYRRWLEGAGLDVVEHRFVPEGTSGHALFWARRHDRS